MTHTISEVLRSILAFVAILIVAFFLIYPRYLDWRASNVHSGTKIPDDRNHLTIQDIAWFGMNPDETCWKHLGTPCRNCGFRVEDWEKSLTGSDNIVIGETAFIAAMGKKRLEGMEK